MIACSGGSSSGSDESSHDESGQGETTQDEATTPDESSVPHRIGLHCDGAIISGVEASLAPLVADGRVAQGLKINPSQEVLLSLATTSTISEVKIFANNASLLVQAEQMELLDESGQWQKLSDIDVSSDIPCDISLSSNSLTCSLSEPTNAKAFRFVNGDLEIDLLEIELYGEVQGSGVETECDEISDYLYFHTNEYVIVDIDGDELELYPFPFQATRVGPYVLGEDFNVSLPEGSRHQCSFSESEGIAALVENNRIDVSCVPIADMRRHYVRITGLTGGLVLDVNGKSQTISSDGSHLTGQSYIEGSEINVSILEHPDGAHCSLTNSSLTAAFLMPETEVTCLPTFLSSRFSKLDEDGNTLPDHSIEWRCIYDAQTGRTWERKTEDTSLSSSRWRFSNSTNQVDDRKYQAYDEYCSESGDEFCHSELHVQRVNDVQLCGFDDWRVPLAHEVSDLILSCSDGEIDIPNSMGAKECDGIAGSSSVSFDTNFFGELQDNSYPPKDLSSIWTGNQSQTSNDSAGIFNLRTATYYENFDRDWSSSVMLVRGTQDTLKLQVKASNISGTQTVANDDQNIEVTEDGLFLFDGPVLPFHAYEVSLTNREGAGSCFLNKFSGFSSTEDITVELYCTEDNYVKVTEDGSEVSVDASEWQCVKDNTSGALWEVKTNDGGLHDKNWAYMHTSNLGENGVDPRDSWLAKEFACSLSPDTEDGEYCHTEAYIAAVNTEGYCGRSNWRLPELDELKSLIFCSNKPGEEIRNGSLCGVEGEYMSPTINSFYFPNTLKDGTNYVYWTNTSANAENDFIMYNVEFESGYATSLLGLRHKHALVRLISDPIE
jgi:hypothetical protein